MIAVLTVMSDMDLSHDELGYGWIGSSWVYLGLVGSVCGMQPVRSLWA
jgi:hypothetical protein